MAKVGDYMERLCGQKHEDDKIVSTGTVPPSTRLHGGGTGCSESSPLPHVGLLAPPPCNLRGDGCDKARAGDYVERTNTTMENNMNEVCKDSVIVVNEERGEYEDEDGKEEENGNDYLVEEDNKRDYVKIGEDEQDTIRNEEEPNRIEELETNKNEKRNTRTEEEDEERENPWDKENKEDWFQRLMSRKIGVRLKGEPKSVTDLASATKSPSQKLGGSLRTKMKRCKTPKSLVQQQDWGKDIRNYAKSIDKGPNTKLSK